MAEMKNQVFDPHAHDLEVPYTLCRGKPAEKVKGNPDWVYGKPAYINEKFANIYIEPLNRVRVHAESVGAFIGMTDLMDHKVFVGDIVIGIRNSLWVVIEIPGGYAICPRSEWKLSATKSHRDIALNYEINDFTRDWFQKTFRVIGNVFDSPHKLGYSPDEVDAEPLEGWELVDQVCYVSQIKDYVTKNVNLADYGISNYTLTPENYVLFWSEMMRSDCELSSAVDTCLKLIHKFLTGV
jgi:hypothetical protein